MIAKARKAWKWLKANWKAALFGVSVLMVAIHRILRDRHRRKSVLLQREARKAEGGVVERVADARRYQHQARAHHEKAEGHQANASAVVERLKAKEGRMGAAEAKELAERIKG